MASRDDIANNRAAISNFGIPKFQPKHPAFASKDQRLRTFKNWAYDEKVSREILAEHCFISTGDADKTVCIHCDTELQNWTKGDDPLEQHHFIYPHCPYVKLSTLTKQRGENELQQESLSGPVTQDFISVLSPTFEGKPKGADETIEKMKADNAALRELITCVLCSKEERSVLLLPCAHWVACTKCALFQTNCPTCGKLIEGYKEVRLC